MDERERLLYLGSMHHICGTGFALQNEYACNLSVTIAVGRTIQSSTCGHIVVEINVNGRQTKVLLQDVNVIPGLRKTPCYLVLVNLKRKVFIPHLLRKAHHFGSLTTRELNFLLAVRRGTMVFDSLLGMQPHQPLRESQPNLMKASWNGTLESAMSTLRM